MAVSDYAPTVQSGKLSSQLGELVVRMQPTPKTIDVVKPAAPHCRLVGFKLLAGATEPELLAAAVHLAQRSGAELVFANDLRDYGTERRGMLVTSYGQVLQRFAGTPEDLADAVMAAIARD